MGHKLYKVYGPHSKDFNQIRSNNWTQIEKNKVEAKQILIGKVGSHRKGA